jgi:tetratricopeptide (TPR) repeat protein
VEVAKKPEPTQPVVPKPPPAAAKPTTPELPDLPNVARYTYTNPARPVDGDRKKANEHFKKARHAHGINRLQQAVAGYKQAIAADPGYQQAHLNLALASHQDGDHAQALKSYEVALKLNPLSIDARYNFALALQQRGFYLDALAESERLLKDLPNLLNGHLLVANLYSENLKLPRRAKPHYEKVLEMNPRHTQAPSIRQWLSAHP